MEDINVGLFNDSFPPVIDGVANTVVNYAQSITRHWGTAIVATPWYPRVQDDYPFDVVRYPSAYISHSLGYRAGIPFSPKVIKRLERGNLKILHSHCPFISTILARELRFQTSAPIVFTYHTKFDIDIEKRVALNPVRSASIKFILSNINACDEVWVVSEGAGKNLRGLGYMGETLVMENGTDFPKGRASREEIECLRKDHGISEEETIFLFVGRMMWYKGVRLSIEGLQKAQKQGYRFKMILIGDGTDRDDMEAYVKECGLEDHCIFTGPVRDRSLLKTYFSLADLFLFPSTYDTNGIVVKEAAACSCPAVLIAGSCAAEGIEDGVTGIIIQENSEAMAQAIADACTNREVLKQIGKNACDRIYLSWDDSVYRAMQRYSIVMENYERKNDILSRNEIFFENVQRIQVHLQDRLQGRLENKAGRIVHKYRVSGEKLKNKLSDIFENKRR